MTVVFIITFNNKTAQSSSPAPELIQWWSNCLQLTQGGSKVRRPCQSTIVGGAYTELCHFDRALRTA